MSITNDHGRDRHAPLAAPAFAALLDRLGPFERRPRLAVAVSGGADSLALAKLAHDWATAQGGEAIGLTVDHGLRPAAAEEARQVAAWLAAWGMAHRTLVWRGAKPAAAIQAAARAARYRLLESWCRDHATLHLLLGHHRQDQAETVLLRLARGSGVDGLAGMPAISETEAVRRLRPLLEVSRGRLEATLRAAGQPWIDDPSNTDPAYARVRWRTQLPRLAAEGLDIDHLTATARRCGQARTALEHTLAELAAAHVTLHPTGWAEVAAAGLAAPDALALRLLARLLMVVAGRIYPPRLERLERLLAGLRHGDGGHSLAGVLITRQGARLRLLREPAAVAPPEAMTRDRVTWDGRFRLSLAAPPPDRLTIGALGPDLPDPIRRAARQSGLPALVRHTLPAIRRDGVLLAVPHLEYKQQDAPAFRFVTWQPSVPLTAVGHCLV